jgi:hypothetical protein
MPLLAAGIARADDPSLTVTIGVLWEGEPLSAANREAIAAFRNRFEAVKVVHFISPVYFTRNHKDVRSRETAIQQMRELVGRSDLAGVYLNGWKSVTEAANVSFKNGPTFWGNRLTVKSCIDDCGREVLMNAYPATDLRKIIKKSRQLFARNSFGDGRLMKVAGHAASPELLAAAAAEGITHDFSAIAPDHYAGRLFRFPLMANIKELWAGVGVTMRPFTLNTGNDRITQMTANGLALEVASQEDILASLDRIAGTTAAPLTESGRHLFVSVPMETMAVTAPKLELAVQEIFRRSSEQKFAVKWFADATSDVSGNKPKDKLDTAH